MKALVAPGPVSYPLIVSGRIKLEFGKEGQADVIADSIVSLIRRKLKVDYAALKELMVIYPNITDKIGVWRKGSAADVLIKALIKIDGINANLVYSDDWNSLLTMLREGKVTSATLSSAIVKGISFEELFAKRGIQMPGSCGLSILNKGVEDEVISSYLEGIDKMREDPEGSAERIISLLPIKVSKNFVIGVIKNVKLEINRVENYDTFKNLVESVI
ncbi:MAG: DUF3834 domain-containing protein [Saccharolobus sp.]|jgi:hypothetical protein|uniref:DUF3834 domain-containing protein n=1 Tax=Saccharolobus sp. TaxID=2100761 RepID=UPI0028CE4D59|nr:DUF3834 domain-containing protein [Saccharolobus sp.]MDT7862535.1 DUF3834 domain-containing protein [Saccharolobus sp.]